MRGREVGREIGVSRRAGGERPVGFVYTGESYRLGAGEGGGGEPDLDEF